ncbi:MAG: glycosyltransferase family 4 protein [Methanomassiliicoccales archaeon]
MRIVMVNPFHYPFLGGIEHRIHHVSKRLARRHDVYVVTGQLPGTKNVEEIDGYQVIRLPSKFVNIYNPPAIFTRGVGAILKQLDPDIIDFHYRWAPGYTKSVLSIDAKKIFTWHNAFGEGDGAIRALSIINDMVFARHVSSFDRIICVSNFVAEDLLLRGFPPELLAVAPNGVELPSKEKIGKEEDYILFIGRLVRTKGLRYLIKAMRDVDGKLIICGSGPQLKQLRSIAVRNDLQKKISFTGRISEESKNEFLAKCMLFVMPSLIESYGIAAAEAMSYGKPVIGTRVGGLPEVIGDGGIIVRPRDPDALARSINLLIESDDLRKELGRKARERAEGFSWDTIAEKVEGIYGACVHERSGLLK